jgi:hypothetical protein
MQEQILLDNKRGWKSTKTRPKVKCFLLTSPLIELYRQFDDHFRTNGITPAVGVCDARSNALGDQSRMGYEDCLRSKSGLPLG